MHDTSDMMKINRVTISIFCLSILILPMLAIAAPAPITLEEDEEGWWVNTTVDRNGNGIGDMVELHMDNPFFLDEDNTLPLIIDFDHTPGEDEIAMLEKEVDYQHEWILEGIDALAGRISVDKISDTYELPGVVMIELDGMLSITNGDAVALHGVDTAWQETGYDGSGATVAIIDLSLIHI